MKLSREVYSIRLKHIRISEFNVRRTGKDIEIEELAESIKKHGLLQPVALRGSHGNPPYELIIGQRRFRAHQLLGRKTIKAVFCGDVEDLEAKILSLVENLHKLELNHADKAAAITELYVRHNRDERRVATELNLPLWIVRDYIKIEEQATPKAKELLRARKVIRKDVKRAIAAAQGDPDKADRVLEEISRLSKYEKDRAVDYGRSHPDASADEIIEQAKKPRIEPTVILSLPEEIDSALTKAARQLSMDRESIAVRALSEWLKEQGYLRPEQ